METKTLVKSILGGVVLLALIICTFELTGSNNDQNWQVLQYTGGEVRIIDTPGYYCSWFGRVTTYPRNWQVEYDKEDKFQVVFNDSSTASMNAIVRFSSPTTPDAKREFNRQFGGNEKNVEAAVWAHISNAMKSSGPIMSSSEHQSARQSEFNQLVQEQLNAGLYETRKVSRELHDQTDEKGKPITVYATEIITDEKGRPKIANPSPLAKLGITITQFSVTHVEYDEATRKQFSQKKDAFLAAENSKAQREKEVQERLMVEEKGRREKAEAEALANRQKAKEVIDAQREKEVAELNANREKTVAETKAAQQVAVATLEKQRAETDAAKVLSVATLSRQTAEQDKLGQIAKAEAQQESLKIAGAISERERVLAEIEKEKAIGVARELSQVKVPNMVISGGSSNGNSGGTENLINLYLLRQLGVLKSDPVK